MGGSEGEAAHDLGEDHLIAGTHLASSSWPRLTSSDPDISVVDRKAFGKDARGKAPRPTHAILSLRLDRRDPVDLLREQTKDSAPEFVALRHSRMLVSPFAYFRGSALAMASDLAATPKSELTAQICGDAHLSNFGVFMSGEERLFFDINDFDETIPGPWEWDVKRLSASLEVFGRDNGFDAEERHETVRGTVRSYREAMIDFSHISMLDVWQAHLGVDQLLPRFHWLLDPLKTSASWHELSKARAHDSYQPLDHLVDVGPDGPRIIADPPCVVPLGDTDGGGRDEDLGWIQAIVRSYVTSLQPELRHLLEHYRIDQVARKEVGVGGAARDTWIVLMSDHVRGTPILLELRHAKTSVAERYLPKGAFSSHGQRIVYGQRLIQGDDDIFLGWERDQRAGNNRDYYVRQLRDWRTSADIAGVTPAAIELWGRMCGWTLARAHARSGDRIAIASYLGKSAAFDRAIVKYSEACADQNERDFQAMHKAVRKGRLVAEDPV